MKRKANAMVLLAALTGGCMSTPKAEMGQPARNGVAGTMKAVPNLVGPGGDPVPATAGMKPPVAKKGDSGIMQAKATTTGKTDGQIRQVVNSGAPYGSMPMPTQPAGAVAATGALIAAPMNPYGMGRTSIRFANPVGMKVAWYAGAPGAGGFGPTMVTAPDRYNFPQGGIYRLKLSEFANRGDLVLYPTLEVIPATIKTATFLAHSSVPISITEEDLEQVQAGNFVVKVLYLPDPAYQDLTAAGPDEVVSSRLEPGVDPVAEAQRRGSVLAILRIGNINLELQGSPGLDQPAGGAGMGNGMGGPGANGMLPPGTLPPGALPPGIPMNGGHKGKHPGQISATVEGSMMRMK